MPYRDRIEVSFDAGHRLLGYQGKCSAPHGHTFRAEVFVEGETLNEMGLVMDFGDLKRPLKDWIDRTWDHAFLVNSDDVVLISALETVPESKVFHFPGVNPSAEAMAHELFRVATCAVGPCVISVRVWESTTQYAEFTRGAE